MTVPLALRFEVKIDDEDKIVLDNVFIFALFTNAFDVEIFETFEIVEFSIFILPNVLVPDTFKLLVFVLLTIKPFTFEMDPAIILHIDAIDDDMLLHKIFVTVKPDTFDKVEFEITMLPN